MAIILRFVNLASILTERIFAIKSVANTTSTTLKEVVYDLVSEDNLLIHKMRGKGYDGPSNIHRKI